MLLSRIEPVSYIVLVDRVVYEMACRLFVVLKKSQMLLQNLPGQPEFLNTKVNSGEDDVCRVDFYTAIIIPTGSESHYEAMNFPYDGPEYSDQELSGLVPAIAVLPSPHIFKKSRK